ncbi:hypothetical protein [[Pseudopropionibacterium] massiliense]|uniref:hypothetical protein n=1 Tax=[Pseudopropionibacterium] massiliense TaxID=2220000 RepID=UPI00102F8FE7|nr:hypothetical protein [[Pseudopropionibacterium] massiliense]
MDERAQQIGTRAATITLAIAYMFWLGVALSKFIGTGRIETAAAEIVFLALIPFVLLWFARQDERLFLPRLREHDDLQELLSPRHILRRTRRYALEALGFSVSLTVADYLAERLTGDIMTLLPLTTWHAWSLEIGGGFLVLLVIDTLWNEFAIHRYIRKIRELEDHEQTR